MRWYKWIGRDNEWMQPSEEMVSLAGTIQADYWFSCDPMTPNERFVQQWLVALAASPLNPKGTGE